MSWRHYVYGMNQIRRSAASESLRAATAARMGQSSKDQYVSWRREVIEESQ